MINADGETCQTCSDRYNVGDSDARHFARFCSVECERDYDHTPDLRALLARALPLLVQLGDFIGNGPVDPARAESLGVRCDLIGDINDALATGVRS